MTNDFPIGPGLRRKQTCRSLITSPNILESSVHKKKQKFLTSTLDPLINPGVVDKINAYYGRRNAKAFAADDNYIKDVSADRQNYSKLEPSVVIKDDLDNVNSP